MAGLMLPMFWSGLDVAGAETDPGPGASVLVVYNRRVPESKAVAEYYASRRGVPRAQVVGLDLPVTETLTRAEYQAQLELPLVNLLEKSRLWTWASQIQPATQEKPGEVWRTVVRAKVKYAVLCFGVPLRILPDVNLVEAGVEQARPELRKNGAAVDSELACLPLTGRKYPRFSYLPNPLYNTTNAASLHPTNGVFLVTRLDGPSAAIARGLVDKAFEAETNGLWGRAYFDSRGMTNQEEYRMGDDWMRGAAQIIRRQGFETILDENPETFTPGFPLSQIAFYAGWYDENVSGPFTRPRVEFQPGAVAYHLHSFSARTLRTTNQNWAGPLLAKGATATAGSVDEPFLAGTPNVTVLIGRLLMGFTWAEAAYAASATLSWQTTVIGDPLYRPFGRRPQDVHADLVRRKSPLIAWSHLRVVDLNLAVQQPSTEMIAYLEAQPETKSSSVLLEKLGDLHYSQGQISSALADYAAALALPTTPQQQGRLLLQQAQLSALFGRESAAYLAYRQFTQTFPDHPDLVAAYRKLLPLARRCGTPAEADQIQRELDRLAPPAKVQGPGIP